MWSVYWMKEQEEGKVNEQMKMTITESDKKLLSYLAAFLIAMIFIMFVFRPLITKNTEVNRELSAAKVEVKNYDKKLSSTQEMQQEEQEMTDLSESVLARFYPMLQSQAAERMATVLMLNHNLEIRNMTISMPETGNQLKWYQYAENAAVTGEEDTEPSEEVLENIQLYAARITCIADGSKEDMWELIDDISKNYPAISITGVEWSVTERVADTPTMQLSAGILDTALYEEGAGQDVQQAVAPPLTVKSDRLTINLEIFMCNQ